VPFLSFNLQAFAFAVLPALGPSLTLSFSFTFATILATFATTFTHILQQGRFISV